MKKTIRDYRLKNKRVILRVDFNVPMEDGIITDDTRIKESLPTIRYAIEKGAKVILMSHLGRIKKEEDKEKNSLKPVSERLTELLNQEVIFIPFTRGIELEEAISNLKPGEVLLMENTRYEDLDGKKESSNDQELGAYWASLGDIYINDAFGTAHRAHASNVGIASHLPSGIGFLIQKELEAMESVLKKPGRPFVVILGGAKVSDKISVIKNLVKKADHILIGGGMAFTFLKAKGYEIGSSILDEESLDFAKKMLEKYSEKLVLPLDVVSGKEIDDRDTEICSVEEIKNDAKGLDIGPETARLFWKYIETAKTIVWNGPMGVFEVKEFQRGTKTICEELKRSHAITIIGGGDSASAVNQFGYHDDMTHISTGGGASLELLEGKKLPGIECIDMKKEKKKA